MAPYQQISAKRDETKVYVVCQKKELPHILDNRLYFTTKDGFLKELQNPHLELIFRYDRRGNRRKNPC